MIVSYIALYSYIFELMLVYIIKLTEKVQKNILYKSTEKRLFKKNKTETMTIALYYEYKHSTNKEK